MKGDELQVHAIERLQPRAQSCHAGPGQFLKSGCFGNTVYLAMRANDEIGDDAFHQMEEELDWLEMPGGGRQE